MTRVDALRFPPQHLRLSLAVGAIVAALLVACGSTAVEADADVTSDAAYPGWEADKFGVAEAKPDEAATGAGAAAAEESGGGNLTSPRITTLSWKPRAFIYHNFLTPEECDHIIALARPRLERSEVVASEGNGSNVDDVRTSFGTFLDYKQDAIISRIESRIATWTFLPIVNQEAMQVLRYQVGQKYDAHHDYFDTPLDDQRGGHRYITVLMYLTEGFVGGETVFPDSKDTADKDDSWSECGKQGVAAKPRKGDALLFFSLTPSTLPDTLSLHAGCPVIEGEKWSATKWIHVGPFQTVDDDDDDETGGDAGSCKDTAQHCSYWATKGECSNNPEYMNANCPKSCGVCTA